MAEHGGCWLQNDDADPNEMPLNPVPGKVFATGTVNFDIDGVIAEHTQQVQELTQRIQELVQRVNERDAVIEKIRTALRQVILFDGKRKIG